MPIWLHLALSTILQVAGFAAGVLLMAGAFSLVPRELRVGKGIGTLLAIVSFVLMVSAAYGGIRAGEWLARRVAARCPECGADSFAEGHRPIRYRCRACGYVHHTNVRANWGGD